MTETRAQKGTKLRANFKKTFITLLIAGLFIVFLFLSGEISGYVISGLNLSVKVIVPSVFPFLLITDLFIGSVGTKSASFINRCFERLFNISGRGAVVFMCGILCGFPIGAKMSLELYTNGIISKCECERLMSFANNASPAYVIFVVGAALRDNIFEGIALYLITVVSAILTGLIIGINKNKTDNAGFITKQNYIFTKSVKQSTEICITICGFITTFAIICGLCKKFIKHNISLALLVSFLEIGNASVHLSELYNCDGFLSFALSSFSISFSGICVISQTASLIDSEYKISMLKHTGYKLLQGIISMLLSMAIFPFLKK